MYIVAPWWVCPVVAAFAYLAFAYLVPALLGDNVMLLAFTQGLPALAPYVAGFILLIGIAANLKKLMGGMLLDRQRGADTISSLKWQEFEELIAAAYRRQGYRVEESGGGGPDGGVDLILYGNGEEIYVQCKQWRTYRVGVQLIREFHGILHSRGCTADRGIFVTFGQYTQDARRFAEENSIELVDQKKLLPMLEAAKKSTHRKESERPSVTEQPMPVQEDAKSPPESIPDCPLCGKPMVLRTARKGSAAGSQFWGCSGFPKCRGIVVAGE